MKNMRTIAAAVAAASMLAGALLAAPAGATTAPAAQGPGQCSLTGKTLTATASVNQTLTDQFTTYAETGGAWTGGDSTYTLPLKGGRTGWFFSDTFLGTVNPDGSRPTDSPFVNNSVVVQKGNLQTSKGLSTVIGGTPDEPAGIIPPEPDGRWYWIGDPAEGPRKTVQVPLLQFERTGPGSFDFQWVANRLATLDGDSLQLESIVDLPSETGINWGSWTLEEGPYTYIYGIADPEGVRSSYVARTTGKDALAGEWSFWNGSGWVAGEADAVPVVPYVANEFSVAKYRDGYLLITQDTSELFSTRIVARTSCSPTGPFSEPVEIYRTPETGLAGSYGDADVFTYNAHEHPNLRKGNRLLVTYNVNTFDNVGDVYDDASIYRPRFIDVELKVGE